MSWVCVKACLYSSYEKLPMLSPSAKTYSFLQDLDICPPRVMAVRPRGQKEACVSEEVSVELKMIAGNSRCAR